MMRTIHGVEQARAWLTRRAGLTDTEPSAIAKGIVEDVRARGDDALREHTLRLDGVKLEAIEVPPKDFKIALARIPRELANALRLAVSRIEAFHLLSMPKTWHDQEAGYGERIVPLASVGIYVPGGTASYPSAVLMDVIPARVAGVEDIVVCTPTPSDAVLAAAGMAGVTRLFQVGGAQAVAALAFGTASVPRVDKVCGAGGVYVTAAKREVYGHVDIDGLYGPTETLIIADATANPVLVASDLLAQAEHDVMATPIVVVTEPIIAQRVLAEIERQLPSLSREGIAREAITKRGIAVVVANVSQAVELANTFAPEHVCLLVENAGQYVNSIRHAGGVFVGEGSPEVMGDYIAGPSHTMPTSGTARYGSYLGVNHFLRHMPVVELGESDMRELGPAAAAMARAEGLTAHAHAVELRMQAHLGREQGV